MWIERLAGDRDDKAELLADHYQQALQLLEQLGEDTSALAPRARAAFVEAAKQAAATYAYPAAARHYRAALRLTPADSMADNAALLMGEPPRCSTQAERMGRCSRPRWTRRLQSASGAGRPGRADAQPLVSGRRGKRRGRRRPPRAAAEYAARVCRPATSPS